MSSLPTASDEIPAFARALIVAGGYNGFSYADIVDLVGIRTPPRSGQFYSSCIPHGTLWRTTSMRRAGGIGSEQVGDRRPASCSFRTARNRSSVKRLRPHRGSARR